MKKTIPLLLLFISCYKNDAQTTVIKVYYTSQNVLTVDPVDEEDIMADLVYAKKDFTKNFSQRFKGFVSKIDTLSRPTLEYSSYYFPRIVIEYSEDGKTKYLVTERFGYTYFYEKDGKTRGPLYLDKGKNLQLILEESIKKFQNERKKDDSSVLEERRKKNK